MRLRNVIGFIMLYVLVFADFAYSQASGWYTEGNFEPHRRIKLTITNPLNVDRKDCPMCIQRTDLPFHNIPQRYITVVDPSLPSNPEPTDEELRRFSGYLIRKEEFGHYIEYQMDDIDRDGIWDELFFLTDIKARENKIMYLYIEEAERGLYKHRTHAGIGYYGRHMVPFWEAEYIGWKLWFPMSVDMHGKREPMLTAYPEYTENLSGYYMPYELGTDIMTVSATFGAGGIGLFEVPSQPDSVSRPEYNFRTGEGPYTSTRYAFEVIFNGPLRSMIKAKTMNWETGSGQYEVEQYYTAYAHKSYSICRAVFTKFLPDEGSTAFACGIREIMSQYNSFNEGGTAISFGKDLLIRTPDESIGEKGLKVDFEGIALVVKDIYKPEYSNIKGLGGNHVFKIPVTTDHKFEYMILGGWSEGAVNRNEKEFKQYVLDEALRYNNPARVKVHELEHK
ncbi:MAG: DUF4861 family protein [Candidatus Latescibacteria bacterium]|nr:DUF4861 family protein [Candidatus Latescibacterota bacterium]